MKTLMEYYQQDQFIDFKNQSHALTACVMVIEPSEEETWELSNETDENGCEYTSISRGVAIGVAIGNPVDKNSYDVAKKIALSRASKCDFALYSTKSGLIGEAIINALFDQEFEFIKENPGCFIKGYHQAQKKYEDDIAFDNELANLNDSEKFILSAIQKKTVDVARLIEIANTLEKREASKKSHEC